MYGFRVGYMVNSLNRGSHSGYPNNRGRLRNKDPKRDHNLEKQKNIYIYIYLFK